MELARQLDGFSPICRFTTNQLIATAFQQGPNAIPYGIVIIGYDDTYGHL